MLTVSSTQLTRRTRESVTTVSCLFSFENTLQINKTDNVCVSVTLRCVHVTTAAVAKQYLLHILSVCVCSLRCPACREHAPYRHLWSFRLCYIFPHYLINNMNFGKKLLNTKCVFWFSLQLSSETFLILTRTERYMIKYTDIHVKYRLVLSDFNESSILKDFFKNIQISDFTKIHRVGANWFSVQTDRQTSRS